MERPLKTFKDANGESWRIKIIIGKLALAEQGEIMGFCRCFYHISLIVRGLKTHG